MSDAYTKLLLHFDGADESTDFIDSSASAHADTPVGNAQMDTAQKVFGTASGLFDGAGDCVTFADHADWDRGADDYTIDCRVRLHANGKVQWIVGKNSSPTYYQIGFFINSSNYLCGRCDKTTGPTIFNSIASNQALSVDTWYHVALVINRTTNKMQLFVGGVECTYSTQDTIDGTAYTNTVALIVGAQFADASAGPFDGWIDELRMSKGIARWTSNFTPPTSEYSYWSLEAGADIIISTAAAVKKEAALGVSAGIAVNAQAKASSEQTLSMSASTAIGTAANAILGLVYLTGGSADILISTGAEIYKTYTNIPPVMHKDLIDPYSGGAWLWLCEIAVPGYATERIARNTEDVLYGGENFDKFNLQIGEQMFSGDGSVPRVTLRVFQDVNRVIEDMVNATEGALGAGVKLIRVCEKYLDTPVAALEADYENLAAESDSEWVTFTLGIPNPLTQRIPLRPYSASICPWATPSLFKGPECQYAGADGTCTGTYEDCYTKGNAVHWGGELGLDRNAI